MRAYIGACTGAEWGAESLVTFMVSGLMMADLRSAPIMILSCRHRKAIEREDETENTLQRRTTSIATAGPATTPTLASSQMGAR